MKKPEKIDHRYKGELVSSAERDLYNQAIDDYEKFLPSEEEIREMLFKLLEHNFMGDMRLHDKELNGQESIAYLAKAIAKRIGK